MEVAIENNVLVIRIPVETPPRPSKSGKTLIVATSSGNVVTNVIVDNKPLTVGLNCYIAK